MPWPAMSAATPTNGDDDVIEFKWFRFSHEERCPNENGVEVRVLFGDLIRSERINRAKFRPPRGTLLTS